MKKIGLLMSVCMGLIMSFSLSLTGNLMSGRFAVPTFLLSFLCSFVLSLLIGLCVPMKPLCDKICRKFHAPPQTIQSRVLSAVVSSLIYTPLLTTVMVFMNTTLAGAAIDRQIDVKQQELTTLTQEYTAAETEADRLRTDITALAEDSAERAAMQQSLEQQTAALEKMGAGQTQLENSIASMQKEKPVFFKAWLPSLPVSLAIGFILSFLFQPLLLNVLMKRFRAGAPPMANRGGNA
ncbi:MAG: hypothetical protein E7501_04350 [Ruminococcus sp.]|nr:hypothetical protein [Ruminococcus sp.]